MPMLNDIKGYWDMSSNGDYNEKNMWGGQLILDEDGWFEGIVNDPDSSYTDDRFVFGAYFPDTAIELLKITPSDISDPFVFKGKKIENGYEGILNVIGLFGEEPFGVCRIITRESKEQDMQRLQSRINIWKEEMVGDEAIELYENTLRMRREFLEILRRKYQGQTFADEEKVELREVTDPIREDIENATAKSIKKAFKTKKTEKNLLS